MYMNLVVKICIGYKARDKMVVVRSALIARAPLGVSGTCTSYSKCRVSAV